MACLLVVGVTTTLSVFLPPTDGQSPACGQAGGVCKFRYKGCAGGDFVDNLCGGPASHKCCIPRPVIDYEALNRSKWRNCYECSYSVSREKERGNVECLTWENGGKGAGANTVNCTGMCSKELLTLDEGNFELVRRCSTDCHAGTADAMLRVHCCWGNLCNSTPGGSTTPTSLILTITTILYLWDKLLGY